MEVATIYGVVTRYPRCRDCTDAGIECIHFEPAAMVVKATFEPPSDDIRDCVLHARMAVLMAARKKVSGPYE